MPYNEPYRAPFRPLPPGKPQLGFDPITIATAVSGFAGKIATLGGLFVNQKDKERIARAKAALASALANDGQLFDGYDARTWINQQRFSSATKTGRDAYQAAYDQLQAADKQAAAQAAAAGVTNGGAGTSVLGAADGTQSAAMPLLLIGGVAVGAYLLTRRKR